MNRINQSILSKSAGSGDNPGNDPEVPDSDPRVVGLIARSAIFILAGMGFMIVGLLASLGYWLLMH